MAWPQEATRTPTTIGVIRFKLDDPDGTNPNRTIFAEVDILDQNGDRIRTWSGDAEPHLLQAEKSTVASFLDDVRARAETQFLP